MSGFEAQVLADQLARLGRDLQDEVMRLGELEETATEAQGEYRRLKEEHEDRLAEEFLRLEGTAEVRRNGARLKAIPARLLSQDAWLEWDRAKGKVNMQQANLSAIGKRIEIGRSLLSREKALLSLGGIGEV